MASQEEIEKTYDYMDKVVRRALGECFDLSCAFYDGNYSLSKSGADTEGEARLRLILHQL